MTDQKISNEEQSAEMNVEVESQQMDFQPTDTGVSHDQSSSESPTLVPFEQSDAVTPSLLDGNESHSEALFSCCPGDAMPTLSPVAKAEFQKMYETTPLQFTPTTQGSDVQMDARLSYVVKAWPLLAEPLQRAILAIIKSSDTTVTARTGLGASTTVKEGEEQKKVI